VALMVDANCAYDRAAALRIGRRLEELDVFHFEEPLAKTDWAGYGWLASQLRVPIAAGELEPLASVHELLLHKGAQIVQPDTMATGFSESRKIGALAEAHGCAATPHAFSSGVTLAAALQLAAATPNFGPYFELDTTPNPLRDELLAPAIRPRRGVLRVPDGPGLGVELDPDALERYRI
jgi:D-galactarolactone cycloisomerase